MSVVVQKYVFVLVPAKVISLYVDGVVMSLIVFVIYPPFTLSPIFCEVVLEFVIFNFIVFELLLVTESFGLSYDFVTLFELSNSDVKPKYSTVKFEFFK